MNEDKPINIKSEIGRLKSVVVHRPGEELAYASEDIPSLEQAQMEHDIFTYMLKDKGIEVLYLDELMKETLRSQDIKMRFISDMVRASKQGDRRITYGIIDYLGGMDTVDMVRKIMHGIRKDEIILENDNDTQLHRLFSDINPFYLDPMPNLSFTRDPATVISEGVLISKTGSPARRREPIFMEYILKYNPRFASPKIPLFYDRYGRFSIEGGDILVLSETVVMIGVSNNTTPEAIEKVAQKLFTNSKVKQILVLQGGFNHLGDALAMVNYGMFIAHPSVFSGEAAAKVYIMRYEDNPLEPNILQISGLKNALREALGLEDIILISAATNDPLSSNRWNSGLNILTLQPGEVMMHGRNLNTAQALRDIGIDVIEVKGSELGRRRGGPGNLVMPLFREAV